LFAVFAFTSCTNSNRESEKPLLFLPDDLEATLWAESPSFFNPTNMDVDVRGRIWITEAVNYRNFNNDSTKTLHHASGDRVVILEDTDGDGRADKSKVFVQDKDLTSPLGIGVIGNRVFVSCAPNLIVYTDEDGDDQPDSKEIFLTGFGGFDHDHSLHAVVGGPDGRLYFNSGNAGPHIVTDKSGWTLRSGSVYTGGTPYNQSNQGNMKSDDGRVWVGGLALRMDPDGRNLRVLAHNFRNAYELAVDSRGDMWQNDNDDQVVACRTTWLMEGGNAGYFSEDGSRYWQADQRPWQDAFTAHWHQDDPGVIPAGDNAGAGSPTGVVVNEGDALGRQYRGMLLSADAGRNVVFGYHPSKQRSGYELGKRLNFVTSLNEDNAGYVWNDSAANAQPEKWFRPSDVAFGTDGALYVADWFDPVVGGHRMSDTIGYGRIYRITPKNRELESPDIDLSSIDGQIRALCSPAVNVRYTGFQSLKNRGTAVIPDVLALLEEENPYYHARAIWLLCQLGDQGIREVEGLLDHADEDIRMVAFRALRKAKPDRLLTYADKLADDESSRVRREVAISLRDVQLEEKRELILRLVDGYDGVDRWYLEALGSAMEGNESVFYADLLKRLNPGQVPADKWDPKLASLVWRLHPAEAVNDLKWRASASALGDDARSKAVTALAFINNKEAVAAMIALSKQGDKSVSEQATYWLTFRQGNDWYALWDWSKTGIDLEKERDIALMKVKRNTMMNAQMPPYEKRTAARAMSRNPVGVQMLLGIVADGQLPSELHDFVGQLLKKHESENVRIQAAGYFRNDETNRVSVQRIVTLKPDKSGGSKVFEKYCATCHQVNDKGGAIGPNLTSIKSKFDRRALLEEIVNPDAGIVFGYEAWTITLDDGQSYFGFLVSDGPQTVTIKDLSGKRNVIETARIKSRKKQEKSLMPSPEALGLTEQDLADLSEYLMTVR
jgi:putative membrane-bound dehydrogenase-like protein